MRITVAVLGMMILAALPDGWKQSPLPKWMAYLFVLGAILCLCQDIMEVLR